MGKVTGNFWRSIARTGARMRGSERNRHDRENRVGEEVEARTRRALHEAAGSDPSHRAAWSPDQSRTGTMEPIVAHRREKESDPARDEDLPESPASLARAWRSVLHPQIEDVLVTIKTIECATIDVLSRGRERRAGAS